MSASQNPQSPVTEAARRAKEAAATLAPLPRTARDAALLAVADALTARTDEIVVANAQDIEKARAAGTPGAIVDRLTLTPERISAIASDVRDVVALADPGGEVVRGSTLPNGLELRQVRVPLGVVGIIYEARPNVTVDAAALCLKSGNAVLLRGSSSAYASTAALVGVLRDAVGPAGLPADAVQPPAARMIPEASESSRQLAKRIQAALESVAASLAEHEAELGELDSFAGNGEHGCHGWFLRERFLCGPSAFRQLKGICPALGQA